MPQTHRNNENIVTMTAVKSLSPQQLMELAQKVCSGKLVPATLLTLDDGTKVVRPVLQELTH